jgi:hypothetical protein
MYPIQMCSEFIYHSTLSNNSYKQSKELCSRLCFEIGKPAIKWEYFINGDIYFGPLSVDQMSTVIPQLTISVVDHLIG